MDKLMEILNELHPDTDFANREGLVRDGILDSLDIVTLITEINDKFSLSIPSHEINSENFDSVRNIRLLIERLECTR